MPKMKPEHIAAASMNFGMYLIDGHVLKDENPEAFFAMIKDLIDFNKKKCDAAVSEIYCKAFEKMKADVKEFQDKTDAEERANSKGGRIAQAERDVCYETYEIKGLKAKMQEEKEKSKISGFVNKLKLKEWGDEIFTRQKSLDESKKTHKSLTKKEFNFKECEAYEF